MNGTKPDKRIYGICTSFDDVEDLNFEKRALYEAAQHYYDEVLLIDSREVVYEFLRGMEKPIVLFGGRDITDITSLHIRSTKGREASIALLVRTLSLCGCDVFDPLERFAVGYASKLLSSVSRFKTGVGTDTYIVFDKVLAFELMNRLVKSDRLPLLVKPVAGKRGNGISVLANAEEAFSAVTGFFETRPDNDYPLLLQRYVNFVAEYRVMVVDGQILGTVQKLKAQGSVAANVAQGGALVYVSEHSVDRFVQENVRESGVLGIDIALDDSGYYHVIETNRAPEWEAFQKVTGVDVAARIVERSVERLSLNAANDEMEFPPIFPP